MFFVSLSVLYAFFPISCINVPIVPRHRTEPGLEAFQEMPGILVTVFIAENPLPCAFAIHVFSFIALTVLEFIDAFSVLQVIFPLAVILVTICIDIDSLSLFQVIHPVSRERRPVRPAESAVSVLHVILP